MLNSEMKRNCLDRLQCWYKAQCKGDWAHGYGLEIGTIDNPGWSVKIQLVGTPLAGKKFKNISIDSSDDEWIRCEVKNGEFLGHGGPETLEQILASFLDWAEG